MGDQILGLKNNVLTLLLHEMHALITKPNQNSHLHKGHTAFVVPYYQVQFVIVHRV